MKETTELSAGSESTPSPKNMSQTRRPKKNAGSSPRRSSKTSTPMTGDLPSLDNFLDLGALKPDAKNARKHNPRNIGSIVDALHRVGAARSIVIDENNRILAGNGTVDAAGEAGITKVIVVETTGNELVAVRRVGLTEKQKTALALFDNRTAELAEWDIPVLKELGEDIDLKEFWSDKELTSLISVKGAKELPSPGELEFRIVVKCEDEAQQQVLLERFQEEGIEATALIS